MSRSLRRTVACIGLTALLFLQFAVAAYACAAPAGNDSAQSITYSARTPCGHDDPPQAKLCEQHCLQASQSVDTQPHSAVVHPVLGVIAVVVRSSPRTFAQPDARRAWLVTRTDPPPLVRFGVLRI